jgi:Carboxypeptidase regulatory-like domain/TonB dependent receptor/TonB-dependent Receptor Plug Domain
MRLDAIMNLKKMSGILTLVIVLAINVFWTGQANAQVSGATLSGTVMDSSGAVIPNAQVAITDVGTGVTRNVTSGSAGFYTAPNLLPATYEVRVTAPGFSTQVQKGITLTVGAQQALDIKMQVGQVSQTVEVTTEAPTVELTSSTLSAVVNATTVRELPLNGRSWTDLATLQPGVSAIQTQPSFAVGGDRGNRGFGSQLSISGARPQENNYRLDGISLNDYGNGAPGSVLGGNMGVDAIQEFSVLTSNYSAAYGKTSGGVVNAVSRSGTNQFHGSLYEFLRNDALDAANFFDNANGIKKPPFRRNQFGASAGGPIRKDRTFIFGDFEGLRHSKGIAFTDTVPSPAARTGILHDSSGNLLDGNNKPIPGNVPFSGACPNNSTDLAPGQAGFCVDNSATKFLPVYPLPNAGLTNNGNLGTFSFAGQQVVSENFVTARVDHKFSDKDSLFGTYMYDDTPYRSPDAYDFQLLTSHTKRQLVTIEENHIFTPALINTVRVGFNRVNAANNESLSAVNPLATDLSLGADPGQTAPDVRISGGIPEFIGGLGGVSSYHYYWDSFQAYDDAFLTRGTHSLKFGVGVERMDDNFHGVSTPSGQFSFGSLASFLTNKPKSFSSALGGAFTGRGIRQTLVGVYVQDDWRARPNLTVNLGLRYEMVTVPTDVQGKLVNLLNITDPVHHCAIPPAGAQCPPLGGPLFKNPTLHNFEPRVGLSWDPFRNGKTAVRAGFGMFDMLPMPYQFNLMEVLAAPYFLLGTLNDPSPPLAGTFFAGAFPLLTNASSSTLRGSYIEYAPHRNYVMQWNMNIQQELTPSLTAMVGYVGSRGVHMPYRSEDLDMVLPTLTSAGYLWPCGPNGTNPCATGFLPNGQKSTTLNPNFGRMAGMFYGGNSFYDALELQLAKKMSHGFQVQGAFTWGKSIDDESGTVAGDQFGNSISALDWFDRRLTRAVSDFNMGKTLVINGIWQVPGIRSAPGAVRWAVNGWQLGGIFKAGDGVPFTATIGGDLLGKKSSKTFDYPNRVAGCDPINRNFKTQGLLYVNANCFAFPTAPDQAFFNANCDPAPKSFGGALPPGDLRCFNLRGNSGRNIMVGPGLSEFDFSVFKNNYIKRISESFNVQFRAELFNVLNHANFAVPVTPDNTDVFNGNGGPTGTAGGLTSTSTTAREIQFAMKVMW